jgi:tetraacyldisaccharide 4'-kinase
MVLWLAEKFAAQGKRVAILSRGYRGTDGTSDEVELLKRRLASRAIFGVGADRHEVGRRLESEQAVDVVLLDDGFQHLELARDLNILMIDGSRELKSEWLLPAGLLREPLSACQRADVIVVTRKFEPANIEPIDSHGHAIFYAQTRLLGFRRLGQDAEAKYLGEMGPGPFFAFCGIGNPEGFFSDLSRWRVALAGQRSFADHYKYSAREVTQLERAAKDAGATALVTTEKDAQNLASAKWRLPVWVAAIELVFPRESALWSAIEGKLATRQGTRA